ncbi:solute carrier family 23 protein [Azorhizobium doebereinerae]|uniref:solute carrier family 23 protein n=1 Tax=Azorhizobium doebereinerae TaxID=281091 RepID=UPI0004216EF4|nr:solute carrier family 23 protein [Azorhizobium doebereinerae]
MTKGNSEAQAGRGPLARALEPLRRLVMQEPGIAPRPRRRPSSLVYGLEDKVPAGALIALSGQHAMLALTFLIYPLVAAAEAGLSQGETNAMLTACAMCIGFATMLQCARSRFGSGYLAIHVPSPGAMPLAIQALALGGMGLMAATTLLLGVSQLFVARLVRPLRVVLPPEVCGVAVTMLGVSLADPALRRALGLEGSNLTVEHVPLMVSLLTVSLIVGVAIFAPRRLKLFAVLTGAAAGWGLAAALGLERPGSEALLASVPLIALPELHLPAFAIAPTLLPLAALMVMMNLVDVLSVTVSLEKMNDADWRRADMRAAGRAVTTCGIANILNGLTSGFQSGLSSSAVGLAFATGATARVIGILAGAFIFATAFFPKAIVALTLIPSPVIGGILLYTTAYLLVAGMELILSRRLSERRVFLVGLSILAGLSVALLPIKGQFPLWAQPLVSTPMSLGTCVAILLNLLFRIGISRETGITVRPGADPFPTMRDFLERQGDLWGARRDVIAAAIPVGAQALEVLLEHGIAAGDVEVRARFDETHLDVFLLYDGEPLVAPKERPSPEALLGEPAEVAAFCAYLIQRLSDRVTFGQTGGRSRIALRFDH